MLYNSEKIASNQVGILVDAITLTSDRNHNNNNNNSSSAFDKNTFLKDSIKTRVKISRSDGQT